jgi:hypothetical protein
MKVEMPGLFMKAGACRLAPVLMILLAACTNPGGMPGGTLPPPNMTITSQKEPPPAKAEPIPPPPAQAPANYFVWDPGHWHWSGQEYVWIAGPGTLALEVYRPLSTPDQRCIGWPE